MPGSYLRFSRNGKKMSSYGSGTGDIRREFEEMENALEEGWSAIRKNWHLGYRLSGCRPGDVVLIEMFKKKKPRPRTPEKYMVIYFSEEKVPSLRG